MKSIQRRFNNTQLKYPLLSSYVCFAKAIKHQQFSKDAVYRWFNALVDKNDYETRDKRKLVEQLVDLSNMPEEHVIRG